MTPTERLTLLRVLILWAMASSDSVKSLINQAYKGNRHEDDLNQPRAVQPWGSDADKRRYFLVEGQDDTAFRIYRESNPAGANRTWWSVAGSIEELQALADKLQTKDGGPKARSLSHKMLQAIPRIEAGEEKRRRREYRQIRKEQFKRPEPGFSMYEGRTRGKRVKYTYSDDEDVFYSDSTGQRRSARNTGTTTPAETGPTTTASGRHVRAPPRLVDDSAGGSVQGDMSDVDREGSVGPSGRPRRSAAVNHGTNGWSASGSRLRRGHSMDTEESESEGEFGDDEEEEEPEVPAVEDSEDEAFGDEASAEEDLDGVPRSLVVKLSVTPPKLRTALAPIDQAPNALANPEMRDWKAILEGNETATVAIDEAAATPAPKSAAETIPEHVDKMDISPAPTTSQPPTIDMMLSKEDEPVRPVSFAPQEAAPAQATSLAFRGSPEKPRPQQLPQPNALGESGH